MKLRMPYLVKSLFLIPFLSFGTALAENDWECLHEASFHCLNNTCQQVEPWGKSFLYMSFSSIASIARCSENREEFDLCQSSSKGEFFSSEEYYTGVFFNDFFGDLDYTVLEKFGDNFRFIGSNVLVKMRVDGTEFVEIVTAGTEVLISQGSCQIFEPPQ